MRSQSREPIDVEWVEGSFLMVGRRCVEAVGPLDPYLFFYWEEADFCRRAHYQGWRVILAPKAVARHYARGSTNQQNKAKIDMLQSKNYYVYKLTNPFQGFPKNFMNAFHMFLVYTKQYFFEEPSSVLFHLKVFVDVLKEINLIYKKWVRDRMGGHPPIATEESKSVSVEVIRGVHKKGDLRHLLV
jgi:GT2 family glycosyltransferase